MSNTNGSNGACTDGSDSFYFLMKVTTTVPNAVVFSAVSLRQASFYTGFGYTERSEIHSNVGTPDDAGIAVEDNDFSKPGAADVYGLMNANIDWSAIAVEIKPLVLTTSGPLDQGPGGPILIVSSSSNPFTKYYAEILRAEGLNEFEVKDISQVSSWSLNNYDVVLLGEMPLSSSQVSMFSSYVSDGGNLIAMRPDKKLAALLGLTSSSSTLSNKYLLMASPTGSVSNLVSEPVQFHGSADLYTLNGAVSLATLYSTRTTPTSNPAVSWKSSGLSGGQAAAFTFDLARSIVYTRQGNPAWQKQLRDGNPGCLPNGAQPCTTGSVAPPIQSHNLFFGKASFDPQPDWVDFAKIGIPQADEQQRFLANLILLMNVNNKPLPRFWYFPRGKKAVVVMTGDGHTGSVPDGRFNTYKQMSPAGCSVANWECVRGTAFIYAASALTNTQATAYTADGFEVSIHTNTNCADWTSDSVLRFFYLNELADWRTKYASVPPPTGNRTHCIVWSDYSNQALVELNNGIRFHTNYYHYPGSWILDRPGFMTGSGMPMRFAMIDGAMVDVYQAVSHMTDQSFQSFPYTVNYLLDRAIGPEGYYGAFTTNFHVDGVISVESDAVVSSALARGVPVVSAKQMLTWLDARNGSSFRKLKYDNEVLSFSISVGTGSNGIQAMLPTTSNDGPLVRIRRNGSTISFTKQTIKGIEYAFFSADAGDYTASYNDDLTRPDATITSRVPEVTDSKTATFTFKSNESNGTFQCSLDSGPFTNCPSPKSYGSLSLGSHNFRVRSVDSAGNVDSTPDTYTWSIVTAVNIFTDTTVADFGGGTPDVNTYISQIGDGELNLTPTAGIEFSGSTLPAGWISRIISSGGTTSVSGGRGAADGADIATSAVFSPNHSLEFVATFTGDAYQSIGFLDPTNISVQALFTTFYGGVFFVRTNNGAGTAFDTPIPTFWLGAPHRYRIDWNTSYVVFSIDGVVVATHSTAYPGTMGVLIEDGFAGENVLSADWLRMTPYSPSNTFISRVIDAGASKVWASLVWTSTLPTGTSLTMSVRTGNTPVPDGTWSSFKTLTSGKQIGGNSRYIQYRVQMKTTDPAQTPTVSDVTVTQVRQQ